MSAWIIVGTVVVVMLVLLLTPAYEDRRMIDYLERRENKKTRKAGSTR